jgi:DnaK suppressor protein
VPTRKVLNAAHADRDQSHFRDSDKGNNIHPMDRQQIQRLKTRLELHRQELRLSIEHQWQYARKAEPEPDVLDQATSSYDKESVLKRSNEEQLLGMIESALRRIPDGSFGQCQSCGKEIDGRRLAAVPWTRYCIQCQEDFER